MLHRQKIAQELDRYAIRQQRGPPGLLIEQLWGAALGEERGNWAPTTRRSGLAGTGIQAWTGEREFAKKGAHTDLVVSFVSKELLTVGTLALLLHILLDLVGRHDLLDASQQLFGFLQS